MASPSLMAIIAMSGPDCKKHGFATCKRKLRASYQGADVRAILGQLAHYNLRVRNCGVLSFPPIKSLDKLLDKLDKFRVLQDTAQLQCKPIKKRGITQLE